MSINTRLQSLLEQYGYLADGDLSQADFDDFRSKHFGDVQFLLEGSSEDQAAYAAIAANRYADFKSQLDFQPNSTRPARHYGSASDYTGDLLSEEARLYQEERRTGIPIEGMSEDVRTYMNQFNRYTWYDTEDKKQVSRFITPNELTDDDCVRVVVRTNFFPDFSTQSMRELYGLTQAVKAATGDRHAIFKLACVENDLAYLIDEVQKYNLEQKACGYFATRFGCANMGDLAEMVFGKYLELYMNPDASTQDVDSLMLTISPQELSRQATDRFTGMIAALQKWGDELERWLTQEYNDLRLDGDGLVQNEEAEDNIDDFEDAIADFETLIDNDPDAAMQFLLEMGDELGFPDMTDPDAVVVYIGRQRIELQKTEEGSDGEAQRLFFEGMTKLQTGDTSGVDLLHQALKAPDAKEMPAEVRSLCETMIAQANTVMQNTKVFRELEFMRASLTLRYQTQLAWGEEQKTLFDGDVLDNAAWSAREVLGVRHWDVVAGDLEDYFGAMRVQAELETYVQEKAKQGETVSIADALKAIDVDKKEKKFWQEHYEKNQDKVTKDSSAVAWLDTAQDLQKKDLHKEAFTAGMRAASGALFKLDAELAKPEHAQNLQDVRRRLTEVERDARKKIEAGHDERVWALIEQGLTPSEARSQVAAFENQQIEEIYDQEYAFELIKLYDDGEFADIGLSEKDLQAFAIMRDNREGLFGWNPDAVEDKFWHAAEFVAFTLPTLGVGGFASQTVKQDLKRVIVGLVARGVARRMTAEAIVASGEAVVWAELRQLIATQSVARATQIVEGRGLVGIASQATTMYAEGVAFHAVSSVVGTLQYGADVWDSFLIGSLTTVGMLGSIQIGNLFYQDTVRPTLARWLATGQVEARGAVARLVLPRVPGTAGRVDVGDAAAFFIEAGVFAGYGMLQEAAMNPDAVEWWYEFAKEDGSVGVGLTDLGKDYLKNYGRSVLELTAIKGGIGTAKKKLQEAKDGELKFKPIAEDQGGTYYMQRGEIDVLAERRGQSHSGWGYYDLSTDGTYVPDNVFGKAQRRKETMPKPDLQKVLKRGVLRIGTSGDYFPFSYRDPELRGIDIEIGRAFGKSLGVRVEFIEFRWSDLMSDLASGEFDIVMSGINITPERVRVAEFSHPYVTSGAVPVVSSTLNVTGIEQLNDPAIRIVVNRGGYLEGVTRKTFPKAQIITTTDNTKLAEYVIQGKADAIMTDSLEAQSILDNMPSLILLHRVTDDHHGFMLPKGSTGLKTELDVYLGSIDGSNTVKSLIRRFQKD